MERLDFSGDTTYNAVEAAIHLNRYGIAKAFCAGARVLDAACGEGYGSYLMKRWGAQSVDGVDIDLASIKRARELFKEDNLNFVQQDVQQLPFEDNVFDLVVSLETMEHVDDAEAFLKEIKRVLKPGGIVILSCPNDNYYYERDNAKNPFHKRTYTFFEFREISEKYLGSYVEYFLGFALDGFMNLPYARRTEPENSIKEDAFGLFHYTECDQTFCVPQERYLNQWNSNYYVGIWGKIDKSYQYNAVIFPRETFIDHKDYDYDLLNHLKDVNSEIETLRERQKDYDDLVEEVGRLGALLESVEREHGEFIKQSEKDHNEILEKAEKERADLLEQMENERNMFLLQIEKAQDEWDSKSRQIQDGPVIEAERLKVLLELAKKERDQAQLYMHQNWEYYQKALAERDQNWEYYQQTKQNLDNIEASFCFRMLRKFDRIVARIKSLFGGKS